MVGYGFTETNGIEGVGVVIGRVSFSSFWNWVVLLQALKKMDNATLRPMSAKNG